MNDFKIDLSKEVYEHFQRLRILSQEALENDDDSFSSRASAMGALTNAIRDLTKTQEKLVTMERLLKTEQALIEAAKEIFSPEEYHIFTDKLEELLGEVDESDDTDVEFI